MRREKFPVLAAILPADVVRLFKQFGLRSGGPVTLKISAPAVLSGESAPDMYYS